MNNQGNCLIVTEMLCNVEGKLEKNGRKHAGKGEEIKE
jgi:hypothetical protein